MTTNTDPVRALLREYRPTMAADVLHAWAQDMVANLASAPPSAPVGVEGLMQLAREWCLSWGEWAHDADPGCAKENAAEAALRAALTQALARQPAACSRCNGTGEADSGGIMSWGAPAMIPCECQQPIAADEAMRKVAAIAHSGGLIDMSPHDALTAIRHLSLPYWGKEEKPEQVQATLATQPGVPYPDDAETEPHYDR